MSAFAIEPWLELQRSLVEAQLPRFLEDVTRQTPSRLREAMAYSLMAGGKRLRPILAMNAFRLLGGKRTQIASDFAGALEMIHTYSLIHDDLPAMDDDDLRRGKPTCHKVFGEATAILAGDGLLTGAFQLLARGDEPTRLTLCALLAAAAGADGMVGGQADDIREDSPRELAFLESLHGRKTGALLAVACAGGAIAAEASPASVEALERYGRHVGLAFQIADDLIDLHGDPSVTGKSHGVDAKNGTLTFPALVGEEAARQRAKDEAEAAKRALREVAESLALEALADFAASRDR